MKNFRYDLYKMGVADVKVAPYDAMETLISSSDFCETWEKHIRDIADFKTKRNGVKTFRNTTYSAIGCLDKNDLLQETRLAFLKAYKNVNWDKLKELPEDEQQPTLWGFLKGSTMQNLDRQIREVKDGIKVPEWDTFSASKSVKENGGVNTNHLTQLFNKMDVIFAEEKYNGDIPNYQNELLGYFIDDVIEGEFPGVKNVIKKDVLRGLFGLEDELMTYKDLGEYYQKSQSTVRKVKERALDVLRQEHVKRNIAQFLWEYKISINRLDLGDYEIS